MEWKNRAIEAIGTLRDIVTILESEDDGITVSMRPYYKAARKILDGGTKIKIKPANPTRRP